MILVVGAPGGIGVTGSVSVYQYNAGAEWWSPKGSKIIGGSTADDDDDDAFGTSASISGDGTTLVVGAPYSKGSNGETKAGRVKVYKFNATSSVWVQVGNTIFGTAQGDQLGYSVSISNNGSIVAVGAPSPGAAIPGYSEVYEYDSVLAQWRIIGDRITGSEDGDETGTSVSLSANGERLAVGAPYITDGQAGYVRVHEYNSTDWVQVGRDLVDISGGAAESVSLSADGRTVAIGARTANNGLGRVRVYHQENMTCEYPFCWDQVGEDIVGKAPSGSFGDAVSLVGDGSGLVVGSPYAEESAGSVRVVMS